jgi:hypothetical protein
MNKLAPVYRKRPLFYKVGKLKFKVVAGNCPKCAWNAAIMAAATGSTGATEQYLKVKHPPFTEPDEIERWAVVVRVVPPVPAG